MTTLKRLGLLLLATSSVALFTGCGSNNSVQFPLPTPTPTNGTNQFVFVRNGATVSVVPFNTTTGAFGTATTTSTQASATSLVNAANVPFAFTIENGALNEYSINPATGALAATGTAPVLAAPGSEIETNATGNELFAGETNNTIEAFAVNTATGVAAHLAAPTGGLTANTTASITSSQVVGSVLVVTESNGNVESFLLNADGSFASATAASAFSLATLDASNTSATASAAFAIGGTNFVAVTGNGTTDNLVDFIVNANGSLTEAPVGGVGTGFGSNPVTVTSTANATAAPIGIVVQTTSALNAANQSNGLTAYVEMTDGAVEAVSVLNDGTFGVPTEQVIGTAGNTGILTANSVVSGFGNAGFFTSNNAGGVTFFNTTTGTATAGTPFAAGTGFGTPVIVTQTF